MDMGDNFKLVKLNVGGKRFITYYDTLKPSTYFQALVKNEKATGAVVIKKNGNKELFIDRDGGLFEDVMRYLRSFEVRSRDREYLEKLMHEAEFFKFHELTYKIQSILNNYIDEDNDVDFELVDASSCFTFLQNGSKKIDTMKEDGSTIIAGFSYAATDGKTSKFVKMTPKKK